MTEKKELILKTALKLFAEKGYFATPTSQIAKEAGVSEGLIFKHFDNKEGLLKAIIAEGENRLRMLFADIVLETNPKEVIRKTIEMPFSVAVEEQDFWRLQFKLKWETNHYNPEKMEPLVMALKNAFEKLNYPAPQLEAEYLKHYLDGISTAILMNDLKNREEMKNFLYEKYQLRG